jgi:2-oxoglutarate dehydrogenase complex dehydrogenase (E1) component-like enzyme
MSETMHEKCAAVQDVSDYLKETYCGSTGVEFSHIQDEDQRLWCHETFERI